MSIAALLLTLLLLPLFAMAEETAPYEVFTFSHSLPQQLKEPLAGLIPAESQVLSGAAIRCSGSAQDDPGCYCAMVLADTDAGLRLYAAAQPEGQPWQVNDYSRFLRRTSSVSISIYRPQNTMVPVISLDYYAQQGLMSDLFCFWNRQLWCLDGHINTAENITVGNDMGMLDLTDALGRESFRCSDPFFLDYMADISAFPTSRQAASALSWLPDYAPLAAGDIVYSEGANLRREPTTQSDSLGVYAPNVPMVFTGKQKPGTQWPWYQVRIGDTIGWMSGNYVSFMPNLGYAPVSLGRTVDGCLLHAGPDGSPVARLEPGVIFHILAETRGMYHICIPAEVSYAVDPQGVYGYIPKADIIQGASISALEASLSK